MASAEEGDVQMGNGFAAVRAVVDDGAEALDEAFAAGNVGNGEEQVPEEGLVLRRGGGEAAASVTSHQSLAKAGLHCTQIFTWGWPARRFSGRGCYV